MIHKKGENDIAERQDIWIKGIIEQHSKDEKYMYALFSSISGLSQERRRMALETFLSQNCDFQVFESLPLEPNHMSWTGSEIPYIEQRIAYLQSLLPLLSGIKYLKHKQKVEHDIEIKQKRKEYAEVQELLEFWS